jgi:hypothetical protein
LKRTGHVLYEVDCRAVEVGEIETRVSVRPRPDFPGVTLPLPEHLVCLLDVGSEQGNPLQMESTLFAAARQELQELVVVDFEVQADSAIIGAAPMWSFSKWLTRR